MVHLHWSVVLEVEIAFRPMPSFVVVQPGLDLSPFLQREKEYKCLLGLLTQINPSLLVNFQSRNLGHFAFWRDDHLLPGFAGREDLSQLTIGSYVSARSSRYEARGKFGEHERCVRVARGVAGSNSSFFSALWLPKSFISRWTHSWRMKQLFYNIFNPMKNFFSRRHERAQLEYEARSRNWIWLDKFTSYVIRWTCGRFGLIEVSSSLRYLRDVKDWRFMPPDYANRCCF